jgi:hypothetical protein
MCTCDLGLDMVKLLPDALEAVILISAKIPSHLISAAPFQFLGNLRDILLIISLVCPSFQPSLILLEL